MCLRAGLTWVRVRFISPFAVSALKHGCSEALPTSQLIPTARVSAAWAAARNIERLSWEGRQETVLLDIGCKHAFAGHGGLPPHRAYRSIWIAWACKC